MGVEGRTKSRNQEYNKRNIRSGIRNQIWDKNITNRIHRLKQFDVIVEHIISVCPILAKEQYINRHDGVCTQLHFNIYKETGVKWDNEHLYDYVVPKSVETCHDGNVTILWNYATGWKPNCS